MKQRERKRKKERDREDTHTHTILCVDASVVIFVSLVHSNRLAQACRLSRICARALSLMHLSVYRAIYRNRINVPLRSRKDTPGWRNRSKLLSARLKGSAGPLSKTRARRPLYDHRNGGVSLIYANFRQIHLPITLIANSPVGCLIRRWLRTKNARYVLREAAIAFAFIREENETQRDARTSFRGTKCAVKRRYLMFVIAHIHTYRER